VARRKVSKSKSKGSRAVVVFWLAFAIIIICVFMANASTIQKNFGLFWAKLTGSPTAEEGEMPIINEEPPVTVVIDTHTTQQKPPEKKPEEIKPPEPVKPEPTKPKETEPPAKPQTPTVTQPPPRQRRQETEPFIILRLAATDRFSNQKLHAKFLCPIRPCRIL